MIMPTVDMDPARYGANAQGGRRGTFGRVHTSARGGHADRFWAVVLACQKERGPARGRAEIGVRVLG